MTRADLSQSAVDAELLLNSKRMHRVRLGAVGFFALLFVALGQVGGDLRWKTDLRALGAYVVLALGVWLVARNEVAAPLAAIASSVYVVRRELEKQAHTDPRLSRAVALIERESAASARIVTDLLDYARERPLELEDVELGALISECVELLRRRPNVEVSVTLPPLPLLKLARDRLRQVLMNLIQNAVEAVPEQRPGKVAVTARLEPEGVVVAVEDDGIGLSPEVRSRIFEPLFTTKKDGTGLGLAIVDSLVRQQGGRLDVLSAPGVGSTFSVWLPR